MSFASKSTNHQNKYRMLLAICRYEYCLFHKIEPKPTRSQFQSILKEKGIVLPYDEFKKGHFVKYNGVQFYIDKEKKEDLNSTLLATDSFQNHSLELSIKKELISIDLDYSINSHADIELIELDSVNSLIFGK